MRSLLLLLAMLMTTLLTMTTFGGRAEAQNYPWCALYSGGSMGGGRNCGFTTFEQCLATVNGIGGTCMANTTYVPPAAPAPHKKSHHSQ